MIIVNLAVKRYPNCLIFIRKRLLTGRNVDNGKPSVGDSCRSAVVFWFIEIKSFGVRPSVLKGVCHRF
jgi:hypothetical protein